MLPLGEPPRESGHAEVLERFTSEAVVQARFVGQGRSVAKQLSQGGGYFGGAGQHLPLQLGVERDGG